MGQNHQKRRSANHSVECGKVWKRQQNRRWSTPAWKALEPHCSEAQHPATGNASVCGTFPQNERRGQRDYRANAYHFFQQTSLTASAALQPRTGIFAHRPSLAPISACLLGRQTHPSVHASVPKPPRVRTRPAQSPRHAPGRGPFTALSRRRHSQSQCCGGW